MENLEEYLSGTLDRAGQRTIEAHLSTCRMCREEIRGMQDVSQLFGSLKTETAWEPSPAFYSGIVNRLGGRVAAPSFTSMFALDFGFGRRLVFASLLTLAVLGSYLAIHDSDSRAGFSPDEIMAQQNSPVFDSEPAPENMLVTLAAYGQQ
jgi:hypothetical protein